MPNKTPTAQLRDHFRPPDAYQCKTTRIAFCIAAGFYPRHR